MGQKTRLYEAVMASDIIIYEGKIVDKQVSLGEDGYPEVRLVGHDDLVEEMYLTYNDNRVITDTGYYRLQSVNRNLCVHDVEFYKKLKFNGQRLFGILLDAYEKQDIITLREDSYVDLEFDEEEDTFELSIFHEGSFYIAYVSIDNNVKVWGDSIPIRLESELGEKTMDIILTFAELIR